MEPLKAKPAWVTFETRAIPDAAATERAGLAQFRNIDYAIVTPAGSKDRIEKIAEDWMKEMAEKVAQGFFPEDWYEAYKKRYASFKQGKEIEVDGLDIKNWSLLTPAQVKNFLALNIRTVEEVADMNEETLTRVGQGSRALKDKAKAFLGQAPKGKVAEELVNLRLRNEALEKQNKELMESQRILSERMDMFAKMMPQGTAEAAPTLGSSSDILE